MGGAVLFGVQSFLDCPLPLCSGPFPTLREISRAGIPDSRADLCSADIYIADLLCWEGRCKEAVVRSILGEGQLVDIHFWICRKLLLDSLLLHCAWRDLLISFLQAESCKRFWTRYLRKVPLTTFLLTQSYFLFYHMISNFTIRWLRHATSGIESAVARISIEYLWIFVLSVSTAFMEVITIASFPYYEMVDRGAMYKYGSFFYAIYFFVSFPMFYRLDANPERTWTLSQTAIDSLGAAMLVTILLDLWRITIGPIVDVPWAASLEQCASFGLPWLQDTSKLMREVRART